jgi:hypothetical protein
VAFLYGKDERGARRRLEEVARSLGRRGRPSLVGVPGTAEAGQGMLLREEADGLVLKAVASLLGGRPRQEHAWRGVESGAYYWRFPGGANVPAKRASAKVPEDFPLRRMAVR